MPGGREVDDVPSTRACGNILSISSAGQSENMLFPSMHIPA